MRSLAVVAILLSCIAAVCADSGFISEAVICQTVSPKGQPVSPNSWFPAGTSSLTLWFRTHDLPAKTMQGQVRWLLGNTTLATREVTLPSGGFGSSTYSLGMDEPLPSGSYQAVLSVGSRPEAKVVVRVGGKAPERSAVQAVIPEDEKPASGSGLQRSARTDGAGSPARLTTTEASAEPPSVALRSGSTEPEVPANSGAGATDVAAGGTSVPTPAVPPAAGAETAVHPDEATGAGQPSAPAVPAAADPDGSAETSETPAAAPAVPPGAAATVTVATEAGGPPAEPPAPVVPPATPWAAGASGPPEAVHIATVDDTGLRRPAAPLPPPALTQTGQGKAPVAADSGGDSVPVAPPATPLGPRTASDTGVRPLIDRSRAPQTGTTGPASAAARTSAPSSAAPLLRTSESATLPQNPAGREPAVAKPALRTGSRVLPPASETSGDESTSGAVEVIRPSATPDETSPEPGADAGAPVKPALDELPSPAAGTGEGPADTTPPGEAQPGSGTPGPAEDPETGTATPGSQPAVGGTTPPAEGGPATADAGPTTAPPGATADVVPTPQVTRFEGPLIADAIAEDLPPLELSDQAVELHRVELVPPDGPISRPGIEPHWVMKVPDGRLWPPSLPHQFPLYAGPEPAPNPEDLFLYSDHIDGIMPLYEVPIAEAGMHMARENQAGLLSVSREMYDQRRVAWQERATTWQWLWYIRDIDLSAGDAVTGCLSDLKRSRRVPEDFQPGIGETLILLDEQGQRVQPGAFTEASVAALAEALGDRLAGVDTSDPEALSGEARRKGVMALTLWQAPKTGRYQLWAALPVDQCQAQSLVWVSRAAQ